jgi:DNA-binding protein WhiA
VSFSSQIKEELSSYASNDLQSGILELFGMLKFRGNILLSGGKKGNGLSYVFHMTPIYIARRVLSILKQLGYQEIETVYSLNNYFERAKSFTISVPITLFNENLWRFFRIDPVRSDWKEILSGDMLYIGDFLRGCFFVGGYVSDPKRQYHLEMIEKDSDEVIQFIATIFRNFFRISTGIIESSKGYKFYIKNAYDMIFFLELMGAPTGAQKIESLLDQRKVKADFNRTINFTIANANKTARSNYQQIRAIRTIQNKTGIEILDSESREIAILRLNNEDLSLSELDALMANPIGKSAIYNRFKKMIKLANQLDEEEK